MWICGCMVKGQCACAGGAYIFSWDLTHESLLNMKQTALPHHKTRSVTTSRSDFMRVQMRSTLRMTSMT